jgi:hypothetical protein
VFTQDKVWLIYVWLVVEQARRNQVCLVYHSALITPARRTQDLVAQPHQVSLELRQHRGRGEIPGERLVAVQQVLGMPFSNDAASSSPCNHPPLQKAR